MAKLPPLPQGYTIAPTQPGLPAIPEGFRLIQEPTETTGEYAAGVGRSLGQGLTFGWGEELEAGIRAPFSERSYDEIRDDIRKSQGKFEEAHPYVSTAAELAGGLVLPGGAVARGGLTAGRLARGALTYGAPTGAAYGLGKAEGIDPRTQSFGEVAEKSAIEAGKGAAAGAVGSVVGNVAGAGLSRLVRPRAGSQTADAVNTLLQEEVPLTAGMITGGLGKRLEDAMTSVPIAGMVVRNAQQEAMHGFNRAALNRALAPIGAELPRGLNAGRDAVDYVANRLGDEYDRILPMVNLRIDQTLRDDLDDVIRRAAGELDAGGIDRLQRAMNRNFFERAGNRGQMSGERLKDAQSSLSRLARDFSGPNASPDHRMLSRYFRDLHGVLGDTVARQNPRYAPALQAANEGWRQFVALRAASASTNSVEGVFSPPTLSRASARMDRSQGRGQTARGRGTMQDLADAARQVLPRVVADSGTPERLLATQALGLGIGGAGAYATGYEQEAIGSGLALAGAYSRPGQALLRAMLTRRPQAANPVADLVRASGGAIGARAPFVGQ